MEMCNTTSFGRYRCCPYAGRVFALLRSHCPRMLAIAEPERKAIT
jgi:hypothetical protein